jgi:hypothetical protein
MCLRYEDLVTAPERKLHQVLEFLALPYESQVAAGNGNAEGFPAWEHPWKARALEAITPERVGLWHQELTATQVALLEAWGGTALQELGYELATRETHRLPWWFYPRVYAMSLWWLACRPRWGDAPKLFRHYQRVVMRVQGMPQGARSP